MESPIDGYMEIIEDKYKFDDKNIICGQAVSRNEFGCMEGLFPSPDNSRLAFYVKDENDEDVLSYYGQMLKRYIHFRWRAFFPQRMEMSWI